MRCRTLAVAGTVALTALVLSEAMTAAATTRRTHPGGKLVASARIAARANAELALPANSRRSKKLGAWHAAIRVWCSLESGHQPAF